MTVLAAKRTETEIILATDSIMVRGYTQDKGTNEYSKLWSENGMVFGCTGMCQESAMLQIFCKTHQPKSASLDDILEFMTEFAGWKKDRTGNYSIDNVYFLIYKKVLFLIEGFFVQEINNFAAHGAGMDFALAALHLGHDPVSACEVACACSIYCEEPIQVHKVVL